MSVILHIHNILNIVYTWSFPVQQSNQSQFYNYVYLWRIWNHSCVEEGRDFRISAALIISFFRLSSSYHKYNNNVVGAYRLEKNVVGQKKVKKKLCSSTLT